MMTSFRVIIDADACPRACLQIIQRLASTYQYELITVASFNHLIENQQHIVVGDESQATDIAVLNKAQPGDIVVTQDWGLAAMVLGKKVKAIAPSGRIYAAEEMDLLLEEREMLAKYRRGGGRTKGPTKRTKEDDRHFEENFMKILTQK